MFDPEALLRRSSSIVIAGLDPATQGCRKDRDLRSFLLDCRVKPGNDD